MFFKIVIHSFTYIYICIQVYSYYNRLLHGLCPLPPPTRSQRRPTRTHNSRRSHRRPKQANNAGQPRPTSAQRQASTANAGQRGLTRDDEDLRQDDVGPNDTTCRLGTMVCFFYTYPFIFIHFLMYIGSTQGQRGPTRASYIETDPPSLQTRVGGVIIILLDDDECSSPGTFVESSCTTFFIMCVLLYI
jgi:hypothetical protein